MQRKGAKPQRILSSTSRKFYRNALWLRFFETDFVFLGVFASWRLRVFALKILLFIKEYTQVFLTP